MMILGPVSYLDCLVFCICLAPQLLIHVGLFGTVGVVLRCLPFLLYQLPVSFMYEHFFQRREEQTPFVRRASGFEDFVVRCVRFAFAHVPPRVGRVFFSRPVALPFLRFRMLRHGYLRWPIHWKQATDSRFKGVWMIKDPMKPIDVCIFYAHGGGFSMGSPYFYLEYLLTWLSLLGESGYSNPAIFSLEYTLVPDAVFPTQLQQAIAAYRHVLETVGEASRVCVSGDSAGATIMLSLLLHLANLGHDADKMNDTGSWRLEAPAMAALISPWVTLASPKHRNTASDYLNQDNLHQYALEYAGRQAVNDPLLSPGDCREVDWWQRACPSGGMFIAYGAEEVFGPDIKDLVKFLETAGIKISSRAEDGGIHAWPVASLFLSTGAQDRQKGLKSLVEQIKAGIPPCTSLNPDRVGLGRAV